MPDPSITQPLLGGFFALTSAAFWAGASIVFRRLGDTTGASAMNLGKGVVALACLVVLFPFFGWPTLAPREWGWLGLSGLLGIALGDTAYFLALVRLGPRRALVISTLTPAVASALAMLLLGEPFTTRWFAGAALCLAGTTWVVYERLPEDAAAPARYRQGIGYGLLAVVGAATGILCAKVGLAHAPARGPLDAAFARLLAGTLGLVAFGAVRGELRAWIKPFYSRRALAMLVAASFFGTFLGIWLQMGALWATDVRVASVLISTSPLFVIPLAAVFLGDRVTGRAVAGAALAVVGVAVLLWQ